MKKTILATVLAIGFAGSAMAQGTYAGGQGSNTAISGSVTSATSSGNGSSSSRAFNVTGSASSVNAAAGTSNSQYTGRVFCLTNTAGGTAVSGQVATGSVSYASNQSYGNATGFAAAGGIANADVYAHGTYSNSANVSGAAKGSAHSLTANGVIAGSNGEGFIAGGNVSTFDAAAGSDVLTTSFKTQNRCGSSCGTPFAYVKVAGTTAGATSDSGVTGYQHGNALVGGINSGTATAGSIANANGKISATGSVPSTQY